MDSIINFFKFCQTEFKYGWMDKNYNYHERVNDALTYSLQTPEELIKSKIGICWDMTELYREHFKKKTNLKYETYYIFYEDNLGCQNHSILVFYANNKVYWFEPMFQDKKCYYSGIHEYDNLKELLKDFKTIWVKFALVNKMIPENYNKNNIFIYKYDIPKYHINGIEMRNHINNSEFIF